MKTRGAIHAAVVAVLSSLAFGNAVAQEPVPPAPLRTYDATELTPDRYTVIKHLWVESWVTAFGVPTHKESSAAIAGLSAEAVKLGADALTNVSCLNDPRAWFERGYFCYGLAVKLK